MITSALVIPWFEPAQLQIGWFTVGGYALLQLAAQLVGMLVATVVARRVGVPAWPLLLAWIIAPAIGIVSGHMGWVLLYAFDDALRDPTLWLQVWYGVSSIGYAAGVIPMAFVALFLLSLRRLDALPRTLDVAGISLAASWVVGRIASLQGHGHPGAESNSFMAFQGICAEHYRDLAYACHDLDLYEAIGVALVLVGMWVLAERGGRGGLAVGAGLIAYSVVRAFVVVVFDGGDDLWLHVVGSSLPSLLMGLAALLLLPRLGRWSQQVLPETDEKTPPALHERAAPDK